MIPEERLSQRPVSAAWLWESPSFDPLISYQMGGTALNDGGQGLLVRMWKLEYVGASGDVMLSAPSVSPIVLFSRNGVTEISLSFDRNMSPVVAFVQSGQAKLWFYDDVTAGFIFWETELGAAKNPRLTHDDRRDTQSGISDVILAYVKDGSLWYRQQRDRYEIERQLLMNGAPLLTTKLVHIGFNTKNRIQFQLTASGTENWTLPQIIEDVCLRAGLPFDRIGLNKLDWSKIVRGYTVGSAYQASGILQTLSSVFFFDPANANGKVSFVPRGLNTVATILDADLIDDGSDEDIERSQDRRQDSIGIPRVLHLNYYDVAGGLNTDKQRSERPEGTRADGEQSLQTPVVMSANEAASVVNITHGMMVEQQKGELTFSLPDNWLRLTESDPVFVETKDKIVRAILTKVSADDGEQRYTAIRDRQSLYTTQVEGIPAAPVTRPPSSVAGPTLVEFLDIPILRDSHDQLGFYMAVSGILPAWPGASIEMSLDGGETYIEEQSTRTGSVLGELATGLGAHPVEYPDTTNTCQVKITTPNEQLENTDIAGMMNRRNRAIIGNEIVNFADTDEVTPGTWDVSYWLRGRKGTAAVAHSIGERFVLLDTVLFAPADLAWLNRTLTFRATTFGRPVDEATIISVVFTGKSQTEQSPAYLQARRDGSNMIASWQGVGRLGVGVNVAMGAYFQGYRLTLTDGSTTQVIDTTANSYTGSLAAFSGPVTARVQQRNQLTGLGPSIEITI